MPGLYLGLLLFSLAGMFLCDRRWKLAFFADARRAFLVVLTSVLFFVTWDLVGVGTGVFFKGNSNHLVGWDIAPEIPIEEVLFLTLLSHLALVGYRWVSRQR